MNISKFSRGRTIGALGVVAVMASAGCATAGSSGDPTSEASTTFRMAWSGHPKELDPANVNLLEEYQFTQLVYETLTDFDDELAPSAELATEWAVAADGLTWTFELVEDAVFHSGEPLTSADVAYSINRLIDPAAPTAHASYYAAVDEAVAVDEHTVELRLNTPMADLASALAQPYAGIVQEGATKEELQQQPNGTGPYVMASNTPGSMIQYTAFEDYRDPESVTLQTIEQVTIAQPETQSTSLTSGDIDLISNVAPQQVPVIEAAGAQLVRSEGASFHVIYLNTSIEPLGDERVRDALRLVMDRAAMATLATGGLGTPTADSVVTSANPFHAELPVPEQDLERARELLAEAGYPDGFEMDLWTTTERYGLSEMAVAYAEMAAEVGITLNVVNKTNSDLGTQGYRAQPMVAFFWSSMPDGDGSIAPYYESNGAYNGGATEAPYFSDAEVDRLISTARGESDPEVRADLYSQAQERIADIGYVLVPYELPLITAVGSDVSGFSGSALGYFELFDVTTEG